ncbi:MAG TPA: alkaline phosphatase family protein, partial [Anaeromyxobacteraceae bacterium]|nr:alkaline phosphatase family protein [Anaeromyxobacteraceae bacterium]
MASLSRHRSVALLLATLTSPLVARGDGDLGRVEHVVILMQENHSFDNYFGVLPYVPGGPYHAGPCERSDHTCVDGLDCTSKGTGLACANWNRDDDGSKVAAFHARTYCPGPALRHDWPGSHQEANAVLPLLTWLASPNDGFVLVNDGATPFVPPLVPDGMGQPDTGGESPTDDATMSYYDGSDLPFYYGLAQTFAIDDRYFSSVMGPTFPNRSYALAGTSFGHVTTLEILPPLPPAVPSPGGYRPITGTIMDLLDRGGISWTNYFIDVPTTSIFRGLDFTHTAPVTSLLAISNANTCTLPAVSFVDPAFGDNALGTNPSLFENDEDPPSDIRQGQYFVWQVVAAIRASPCWQNTVAFIVYDEHGGFYDHVPPPLASQGHARTPDGIAPGQCADASRLPESAQPGGGAECTVSRLDAAVLCPGFSASGPYPGYCPSFDQLGFRVPFVAVSPFARRRYVSHEVADHASLLAFIEKRFLGGGNGAESTERAHLTARDLHASTLEDLFDFDAAPNLDAVIPTAPAPASNDPGCPFHP